MTKRFNCWQILNMIAFSLLTANAATANPDFNKSIRLLESPWVQQKNEPSFSPGKTVCSLAGALTDPQPEDTWTTSSMQSAPTAKALPVDIVVNQFSSPKFGQIGFTPQCLFVDHSAPRGYLESKIANTLATAPNPIYDTHDLEPIQIPKSDPYWEYYSDCDHWNVVFSRISDHPVTRTAQPRTAYRPSRSRSTLRKLKSLATWGVECLEGVFKKMEFIRVEMKGVSLQPKAQEFIIKQFKNMRPFIKLITDHEMANSWLQNNATDIRTRIDETALSSVWTQFQTPHVYYYGELVEIDPTLMDRLQWIAHRIEQVANQIKIR